MTKISSVRQAPASAAHRLLLSTALATSLAGVAFIGSPGTANAACDFVDGANVDSITCNGTTTGISETPDDDTYVYVVEGTDITDDGVYVDTSGVVGAFIDVEVRSDEGANAASVNNNGGHAFQLLTQGGEVTVVADEETDLTASGDGFRIRPGTGGGSGAVTMNLSGDIAAEGGEAVDIAGAGAVTINLWDGTYSSEDSEVFVVAESGSTDIMIGSEVEIVDAGDGDGGNGVYVLDTVGDVSIENFGTIGTDDSGRIKGAGILVDKGADTGSITVGNYSTSSINTVGDAINLSGAGNITVWNGDGGVDNPDGVITSTAGNGIVAVSSAGYVVVNSTGSGSSITAEEDGIYANVTDGAGDTVVNVSGGSVTSNTNDAIEARNSGSGDIFVNVTGNSTVTSGNVGGGDNAIQANAEGSGDVNVFVGFFADLTGTENGIDATSAGDGDIFVTLFGDVTQSGGGGTAGIQASQLGGADMGGISIFTGFGSEIDADQDGIIAQILDSDNGSDIDIVAFGDIDSENSDGIVASTVGLGGISIFTGFGSDIDTDGDGIVAQINNGGSSSDIDIVAFGDIDSESDDGIAVDNAGSGAVNIALFGDISAGVSGDAGIEAIGSGTGDVNVTTGTDSDITASDIGIDARATGGGAGDVMLNLWGDVDTGGTEIVVESTGTGSSTVNNWFTGVINGDAGISGANDLVIDGVNDGNGVEINNFGTIYGRVDLTDSSDTFNNYSSFTWVTVGDNDFGDDDDVLTNPGVIVTAVDDGAPETTSFLNLETFVNGNDSPFFGLGTLSMQDGGTGDLTYTSGDFEGIGNSTLALDVELNGSLPPVTPDFFEIDGEASGMTGVDVNDLNSAMPATYDPTGVQVIDAATSASGTGDEFYLSDGPIDAGLFTYDLYYVSDSTEQWWLRNGPGERAFELATVGSLAQRMFWDTADTWHDRTADLRSIDGASKGGAWLRGFGSMTDRDHSYSYTQMSPSMTFTSTGSSDQTIGGVVGGADAVVHQGGTQLVFGVMGSYTHSQTDFDPTGTSVEMSGFGVGAYATALYRGFFIDAVVRGQFFDMNYTTAFPWSDSASADGSTYGFIVDAGYRAEFDQYYIEPLATIAYGSTDVDGISLLNNSVSFDPDTSLRGRLGARIGGEVKTEFGKVEPFATFSVWNEFSGNNTATILATGSSPAITLNDDTGGVTYEAKAGVDVFNTNGWSGFVSGSYVGGNDTTSFGGQFGLRRGF